MKAKILLYVLLAIVTCQIAFGQSGSVKYIDSLRTALKNAKTDTSKIKLRYEISDLTGENSRMGYWDTIYKEARAHNLKLIECNALAKLVFFCNMKSDTANRLKYSLMAIEIAEANHYYKELFSLEANLGHYYIADLHLKQGLNICFKGLKQAEAQKNMGAILDFNSLIGTAYFFAGDFNKTLNKRLENLRIYEELKDTLGIFMDMISIGDAYTLIKDFKNATYYYFKSTEYFKKSYGSMHSTGYYKAMGSAYQLTKKYDSADYFLNKAYKLCEERESKKGMASVMSLIAQNNNLRGRLGEAKKQALKTMQLCKETDFLVQIPSLALTLKEIYSKEENYKEALKYYELSMVTKDSIANDKNQKLTAEKEYDYEFEKKENENKLLEQKNQIQALELKQNNYFLIGLGALLILIVFIGYLFIYQNKLRNKQQSTRLEQKLLLSQMNPHFIFNSLQAIQNFILKHDEKAAVKYLSSFAAVTRNVLENSRMEFIPLKKEIALLENYLQLQKLRFNDRFNYEIKVDEAIDVESIMIPPMLSQPFIENSIEHGFHDVENDGLIMISYALKNNELMMEISDNGNGIKNDSQLKKHRSLALEITKERVVLMNKKAGKKMSFNIGEAFPLQDKRKGVKVSFCFPLNWQV